MKKLPLFSVLVISLLLFSFTIQRSIDDIISALRTGNATELSRYFDDVVELTLPDKSDSYSKTQAQLIIKDFFNKSEVKTFELKHKGDSPGGQFFLGTLQTQAGNYRTLVFMKNKNGKEVIREIRFQKIE